MKKIAIIGTVRENNILVNKSSVITNSKKLKIKNNFKRCVCMCFRSIFWRLKKLLM